jgi:hypothetical protein
MAASVLSQELRPCLLALLAAFLAPAFAAADSITVHNDTKDPIVVQASCLVRGRVVRDRPFVLKAGETSPKLVVPPGAAATSIAVYDAKAPTRLLFRDRIPAAIGDQEFALGFDGAAKEFTLNKTDPAKRK